jgi:bacteriocin-like protein
MSDKKKMAKPSKSGKPEKAKDKTELTDEELRKISGGGGGPHGGRV